MKDIEHFTHHATFYGIPCYFKSDGEGCDLMGTNWFYDWLILHICPLVYAVCETIDSLSPTHEDGGFPILVGEPIRKAATGP